MSKSIQEQMAEALATKAGENPQEVLQRMQVKSTQQKSALAQMLDEVKAQKAEVGTAKVQAKAAKTVAKKNTEENDVRPVILLMSESRQEAYISVNKRYKNKTEAEMLEISKKYLKAKKKLQPLLNASDLIVQDVEEGKLLPVVQAELRKVELHKDMEELGYHVMSPLPKNAEVEIQDEV